MVKNAIFALLKSKKLDLQYIKPKMKSREARKNEKIYK